MSAVEQFERIAKESWEGNPTSQPARFEDTTIACALAEDLLRLLIKYPGPFHQISDKIYLDLDRREYFGDKGNNTPSIGVSIVDAAVSRLIEGGGINYLSFETHPEWTLEKDAASKRWLKVRGFFADDSPGMKWETEYIFKDYIIKKRQKIFEGNTWRIVNEDAVLEQADLEIIGSAFLGICNQVVPLLIQSG